MGQNSIIEPRYTCYCSPEFQAKSGVAEEETDGPLQRLIDMVNTKAAMYNATHEQETAMVADSVLVGLVFIGAVACRTAPEVAPPLPTHTPSPTPTPKPRISCPEKEVASYLDQLDLLLEEFDDTAEIAGSTPRMGLGPVIQDLQSLRRNARRLDRPECANYLQNVVVMAIKAEIDAFISFLSKDDDSVVSRKFTASKTVRAKVERNRDQGLRLTSALNQPWYKVKI